MYLSTSVSPKEILSKHTAQAATYAQVRQVFMHQGQELEYKQLWLLYGIISCHRWAEYLPNNADNEVDFTSETCNIETITNSTVNWSVPIKTTTTKD